MPDNPTTLDCSDNNWICFDGSGSAQQSQYLDNGTITFQRCPELTTVCSRIQIEAPEPFDLCNGFYNAVDPSQDAPFINDDLDNEINIFRNFNDNRVNRYVYFDHTQWRWVCAIEYRPNQQNYAVGYTEQYDNGYSGFTMLYRGADLDAGTPSWFQLQQLSNLINPTSERWNIAVSANQGTFTVSDWKNGSTSMTGGDAVFTCNPPGTDEPTTSPTTAIPTTITPTDTPTGVTGTPTTATPGPTMITKSPSDAPTTSEPTPPTTAEPTDIPTNTPEPSPSPTDYQRAPFTPPTGSPNTASPANSTLTPVSLAKDNEISYSFDFQAVIYIVILSFILVIAISAIYSKVIQINDFYKIGSLLAVAVHFNDSLSDAFFCIDITLQSDYPSQQLLIILWSSIIFLIIPSLLTIYQLYKSINEWRRNDKLIQWLSNNIKLVYFITIIAGSSFAAIELCTSNLFNLRYFDMPLSNAQFMEFQTKSVYSIVLLEVKSHSLTLI